MGSPDRGSSPQVVSDLSAIARALEGYPALARALTDPSTSEQDKDALVDAAIPQMCDEARLIVKNEATKSWESSHDFTIQIGMACVDQAWAWAQNVGSLNATIDQVFAFGQALAGDHELRAVLTDRRVDIETRQGVAETVAGGLNPPAVAVVRAVVGFDYATIDDRIRDVIERGVGLISARLVVATTARPLEDDQRQRLADAMSRRLGCDVIIEEVIDPSVIGGVRVECGAELIDSTIVSRLEAARRALT